MSVTVDIPNIKQARADVRKYMDGVSDAVKKAANLTGINIQRKAKKNVRGHGLHDDGRRVLIDTGLMSSSIHITFDQNLNDARAFAKGDESRETRKAYEKTADAHGKASAMTATAGAKMASGVAVGVHYAEYHEKGVGVPMRPFPGPAAESERRPHTRRMMEALRKK